MPKIALFDLEGTLVENEFLVDLAELNCNGSKVMQITEDAMSGRVEFGNALRERMGLIKGITKEDAERLKGNARIRSGAHSLIKKLGEKGFETAIVSGGFSMFAGHIAEELGIEKVYANDLDFEGNRIIGATDKISKNEIASAYISKGYSIISFGDGANDVGMFGKSAMSFAVGNRAEVASKADFTIADFAEAEKIISNPIYLASKDVSMPEVEGAVLRFRDNNELENKLALADVLILRTQKLGQAIIEKGQNLKLIVRQGVGLDGIDLDFAKSKGIEVVNTPLSTPSVSELVIGMMIMASRNLAVADSTMKEGKWSKPELLGTELFRKNLGIIGLGRVGRQVARVCRELGMRILYYDPYVEETIYKKRLYLEELLSEADVLTIHCPLTEETRHMLNMDNIKLMKKGAILVNTARGKIIHPEALEYALKEKVISSACLDVHYTEPPDYSSSLFKYENIVLSPHIGGNTVEAMERMRQRVKDILVLRGYK